MSHDVERFTWTPPTGWRAVKLNVQQRLHDLRWQILSGICSWVGHAHESYKGGVYFDRGGRMRDKYYSRCTRCGCDSAEVYTYGRLEQIGHRWRDLKADFRHWRGTACDDCGKPDSRFGRAVGNHDHCDQIPF